MSFPLALLTATAGSVLGALLLYALGRWGGRPLLLRWGRVLRLDRDRASTAPTTGSTGTAGSSCCSDAMVPGMRSIVSIPAGSSEMPVARFLALTAAGALLWNAALIGAGWSLGSNWHRVEEIVAPIGMAVLVLMVVAAAVAVLRLRARA